MEGFLPDPVQRIFDRRRRPLDLLELDPDREVAALLDRFGVGTERTHDPVLLKARGPEREHQRAHLRQRVTLQSGQVAERPTRGVRVTTLQQHVDGTRLERHREQRLRHRIVQLPREVRPFLRDCELGRLEAPILLDPVELTHVARDPLHAGERAVGGLQRARRCLDETGGSVTPQLEEPQPSLPGGVIDQPLPPRLDLGKRARVDEREDRTTDQLVGAPAREPLAGVREEREVARGIGGEQQVRRLLDEEAVALLDRRSRSYRRLFSSPIAAWSANAWSSSICSRSKARGSSVPRSRACR